MAIKMVIGCPVDDQLRQRWATCSFSDGEFVTLSQPPLDDTPPALHAQHDSIARSDTRSPQRHRQFDDVWT